MAASTTLLRKFTTTTSTATSTFLTKLLLHKPSSPTIVPPLLWLQVHQRHSNMSTHFKHKAQRRRLKFTARKMALTGVLVIDLLLQNLYPLSTAKSLECEELVVMLNLEPLGKFYKKY